MRTNVFLSNLLTVSMGAAILFSCTTSRKSDLPDDEVIDIARQAYIYAMPLIYTDVTRIFYNEPDNYLHHANEFPDHTFRNVVAPNNDTNYSIAFLQLGEEPVVVELPSIEGCYYVFPLQDAWTNNFALPGTRTTGTGKQKYMVSGPSWQGEVPEGLTHIQSPTNMVWAIGRIQVNSPEDQRQVVAPLQQKFIVKSLSAWQGRESGIPSFKRYGHFVPEDRGNQSVVEIVKSLSIEDYFNYFNALLVDNPPAEADSKMEKQLARLGIGAGKIFSLDNFSAGVKERLSRISEHVYKEIEDISNGGNLFGHDTTDPHGKLGDYKTDYNLRAIVAYRGLGALPPEEALYYGIM
ncbi:MAG: DUF1254 domain-containing protein [Bacteroides sp.]|nr:DUF1254 domain-containing protein [Bacteroides sp.]